MKRLEVMLVLGLVALSWWWDGNDEVALQSINSFLAILNPECSSHFPLSSEARNTLQCRQSWMLT